MWRALLKKELMSYFLSPVGYAVMFFHLLFMGLSCWLLLSSTAGGLRADSLMTTFVGDSIFFWLNMLVITPLITMRLFAEEKNRGTIESLLTLPVRDVAVVTAKYVSALLFFIILWIPVFLYPFLFRAYFFEQMYMDAGVLFASALGVLLTGMMFIAVGCFASSVTRNQIIAALLCFTLLAFFFMVSFAPYIPMPGLNATAARYVSIVVHMGEWTRGIIDMRPAVCYLSTTAFFLYVTVKVLEARAWKQ